MMDAIAVAAFVKLFAKSRREKAQTPLPGYRPMGFGPDTIITPGDRTREGATIV
jgi:hypothetical protein